MWTHAARRLFPAPRASSGTPASVRARRSRRCQWTDSESLSTQAHWQAGRGTLRATEGPPVRRSHWAAGCDHGGSQLRSPPGGPWALGLGLRRGGDAQANRGGGVHGHWHGQLEGRRRPRDPGGGGPRLGRGACRRATWAPIGPFTSQAGARAPAAAARWQRPRPRVARARARGRGPRARTAPVPSVSQAGPSCA